MKRLIGIIWILTMIVPALSMAVTVGESAIVPNWEWVDVLNDRGIEQQFRNGTKLLQTGDTCGIEEGGTITVVKFVNSGKVLVQYSAPGSPMGTPCPSGVLFEIATSEFETMTDQYNNRQEKRYNKKEKVLEVVSEMEYGDSATIPDWQWVDVLNLRPVSQNFSNGTFNLNFEETCGVEAGGVITVRGEMSKSTYLVEYTAPGSPMGTPCPSGVLFEINKKTFERMR